MSIVSPDNLPPTFGLVNGKPFTLPLPGEKSDIRVVETVSVQIDKLRPHPQNVKIYGDEDVSTLAQSIAESGWIRPLTVTHEHVIVSGHRRYLAAMQLGYTKIPIEFEEFASEDAMMERLLRENENRGKTPEQQIREGMAWEPIERAKAERREKSGNTRYPGESFPQGTDIGRVRDIIARRAGLGSGKIYEHGKEVIQYMDAALFTKDREAIRMALNEQSISAAYKLVQNYKAIEERMKREETEKEAERQRQQEFARQRYLEAVKKAEHCTLYHCSVADLSQHLQPDCIDCIITDPPYPKEYLSVYDDLARFAFYALKPGGSLVVMVGQSYLPEIIEKLSSSGLTYQWTCAYLTLGGQSPQLWQRNVNSFWKPLLWFVKGEYTGEWIGDVCKSEVNHNDKSKHHWGQSESGMQDILERFTKAGQLICDPFVGGGTTATVAMEMERRFIGCDIDASCVVALEEAKTALVRKEGVYECL